MACVYGIANLHRMSASTAITDIVTRACVQSPVHQGLASTIFGTSRHPATTRCAQVTQDYPSGHLEHSPSRTV